MKYFLSLITVMALVSFALEPYYYAMYLLCVLVPLYLALAVLLYLVKWPVIVKERSIIQRSFLVNLGVYLLLWAVEHWL